MYEDDECEHGKANEALKGYKNLHSDDEEESEEEDPEREKEDVDEESQKRLETISPERRQFVELVTSERYLQEAENDIEEEPRTQTDILSSFYALHDTNTGTDCLGGQFGKEA